MDYFSDIKFVAANILPNYKAKIDQRRIERYSLEFILSGRMYYGIDGKKPVIFSEPTVYWLCPNHIHKYGPVDKEGYEHCYVTFLGPRGRRLMERGFQKLDAKGYVTVPQPETLARLYRELVQLIHHQSIGCHNRSVLILEEILYILSENQRIHSVAEHHRVDIENTATLIRNAPYEKHVVADLAKAVHLSESHFRKLFRRYIGSAINDYMLFCKMRKAATDLEQTSKTATQIAYEAGYDELAPFSKMFKNKIGVAPRDYRESFQRTD